MNLEDVFCEIKTDCCNIAHGWLPLLVIFDDHHLGTSMPSGGHPPHQLASLCTCRKNYARFRQFFSVPVSPDVPTAGGQHDAIGGEGMPREELLANLGPPPSG